MYADRSCLANNQNQKKRLARWGNTLRPLKSALIAILFVLSGCGMVGPDLVKPTAPLLDDWKEKRAPGLSAGQTDYSNWWRVFHDPVLNNLVKKAYEQNLSLQIAGIRIYEARAQLGVVIGNLYPQQQSISAYLKNNKLGTTAETPFIDGSFNNLSLGFDATWELDVWGKFRRSVQTGVANLQASVASYDNVLVSLTAEVARTYILMRTFERQIVINEENVRLQELSLRIAEVRFKEGAVSELDVTQAKSLLRDTQSLSPGFESGMHKAQNSLAILLGVLPGELKDMLRGPITIPAATETVVVDIPKNLLRRRPDIRLAELRVATQSPQIGIAKADLYPHFFLFGSIGWRSSDASSSFGQNTLGDIFSYKSFFWNFGPGISWDILNYGRIRNRVRVEDARFQQLVVSYKDTVLNAQREVEDSLVAFTRSRREKRFLEDSVAAAKRSVELSLVQYKEGLIDYQRVLDSQRFLANQSNRLTDITGKVSTNLVATYKALGGGWQTKDGKRLISSKNRNEMIQRTNWGGLLGPEGFNLPIKHKNKQDWQWPDW
jgi:NodT family efflux transporter outer membrane factor (OMF) lipoprotein